MKTSPLEDGKLLVRRSEEDRKPLIDRLNRVEGQIRGLKAMIEADRYCGEELHQIKAAIAALRRVAIMLSEQHIAAAAKLLPDQKISETVVKDITRILHDALEI